MNTQRAHEAPNNDSTGVSSGPHLHYTFREIRCPIGPQKLLAKMKMRGNEEEVKRIIDNLLELSCRDCTKKARREAVERGQEPPLRVLHRYNIAGELVETVEER